MGDGGGASGGGDGKSGGGGSSGGGGGSNFDSYIGSLISLTSKSDIRYEGVLYTIDAEKCNIALAGVRSFGTEGRKKDGPQILPTDKVYEYIIFRGSDIKDLQVKSSPQAQTIQSMQSQPYSDPAIIAQSHQPEQPQRTPPTPSYPPGVGMNSWPRPPPVANGPMPMSWGPRPPPPVANGPMPMYWPGYYPPTPQYLHSPGVPPPEPLLQPPPEQLLQKADLSKGHPQPPFLHQGFPQQQGISSAPVTTAVVTPMAKLPRLPSVSQVPSLASQMPTVDLPPETTKDLSVPESVENFQHIPELVKKPVPSVTVSAHPSSSQSQHPTAPPARDGHARDYQARDHQPRDYQPRDYQPRDYQPREHQTSDYRHHWRGNGRGRGRGRPATHHRTQNFTEDFDFTAMNEKFNKDEVWGELGKSESRSDEDDASWQEDTSSKKPVYCKDDFFDSLSCDALDRAAHADRPRFSEQRKINTETFGDTFLRSRGRGYRGYRGGQSYRGRGRHQATASS